MTLVFVFFIIRLKKSSYFCIVIKNIMIQRIQSVYLLLTTVLSVLFLSGNMVKFTDASGNIIGMTIGGVLQYHTGSGSENAGSLLPLVILVLLTAAISFLTIFLFRNRKLQIRLTAVALLLSFLVILAASVYATFVMREFDAEIIWSIKMTLPVLMVLFLFLAYRGIRKDDELVKSYDRLR